MIPFNLAIAATGRMSPELARQIVANPGLYRARFPAELCAFLFALAWQVLPGTPESAGPGEAA